MNLRIYVHKRKSNWQLATSFWQIVPGFRKQVKLWTGNKPAASSKQPAAFLENITIADQLKKCRQRNAFSVQAKDLGGYSVGVPPLPIPNREVKPDSADGTA